jgi:uroporphyrinogen-III synthase
LPPDDCVRLLVTRPEPECERTAALLRERGHEVLLMPLLRIEPIVNAELGAGPWAAVIFTSANAVRAVAAHPRFKELAGLPAYTVGRRTQAAAATAGFTSIASADGDVNALVRLIVSKPLVAAVADASLHEGRAAASSPPPTEVGSTRLRSPSSLAETRVDGVSAGEGSRVGVEPGGTSVPQFPDRPPHPSPTGGAGVAATWPQRNLAPTQLPLLYLAGEDRAGNLADAFQPHDLRVETAIVYRATLAANLPPDVRIAIASGAIDAVLHYSARTAVAFVTAATRAGIRDLSIQTRHLCLSPQVAAPLAAAGARTIEIASEANEQALLTLISQT